MNHKTQKDPKMKVRERRQLPDLFRSVGKVLLELFIIFAGVYSAFLLNAWKETRQVEEQRRQILSALLQNIEIYADELRQDSRETDSLHVRPFITAYENGEMPISPAIPMGASGASTGLWEAMLQAGGLAVLDVETISRIEFYYMVMRHAIKKIEVFDQMQREQLIPRLDNGIGEFYNLKTMQLHQKYAWYPQMLQEMGRQIQRLSAATDTIVVQLRKELAR